MSSFQHLIVLIEESSVHFHATGIDHGAIQVFPSSDLPARSGNRFQGVYCDQGLGQCKADPFGRSRTHAKGSVGTRPFTEGNRIYLL